MRAATSMKDLDGEDIIPACKRFHFLHAAVQLTLQQPSLSDIVPELTAAC